MDAARLWEGVWSPRESCCREGAGVTEELGEETCGVWGEPPGEAQQQEGGGVVQGSPKRPFIRSGNIWR